jgi:hypothetical protein
MSEKKPKSTIVADRTDGLAAVGSCGSWSVDLDESQTAEEWFAQIEGPSVYLSFSVQSPRVIKEMLSFLIDESFTNGEISLWKQLQESVTFARDDEFNDRYYLIVKAGNTATRVTFADQSLKCLKEALRQAGEDIDDQ